MKRTLLKHALLLAAILHLFADVAFAGGAVLCVGPNDHSAIEVGHLAADCETLAEVGALASMDEFGPGSCNGCIDSPLHAEPEIASKRISSNIDAPALLAPRVLSVQPAIQGRTERLGHNRLDLSMTVRAHRSTVLLI